MSEVAMFRRRPVRPDPNDVSARQQIVEVQGVIDQVGSLADRLTHIADHWDDPQKGRPKNA